MSQDCNIFYRIFKHSKEDNVIILENITIQISGGKLILGDTFDYFNYIWIIPTSLLVIFIFSLFVYKKKKSRKLKISNQVPLKI